MTDTRRRRWYAGAVVAITLLAGCSSSSANPQSVEHTRAVELVSRAHTAGVAPRLTVDTAEALYGKDAPAVCDAFEQGLNTPEELILLGNPSGRRAKPIPPHAVRYGRIVVQTYCPDELEHYEAAVKDLRTVERTRR